MGALAKKKEATRGLLSGLNSISADELGDCYSELRNAAVTEKTV